MTVEVFLGVGIFSAMRAAPAKHGGKVLSDDPLAIFEAFAKLAAALFQSGSTADRQLVVG
jgi:hypothetical protein